MIKASKSNHAPRIIPKTITHWVIGLQLRVRASLCVVGELPNQELEAFGRTEVEALENLLKESIESEEASDLVKEQLIAWRNNHNA